MKDFSDRHEDSIAKAWQVADDYEGLFHIRANQSLPIFALAVERKNREDCDLERQFYPSPD